MYSVYSVYSAYSVYSVYNVYIYIMQKEEFEPGLKMYDSMIVYWCASFCLSYCPILSPTPPA